uniref:Transmembrane protein n=1 Tax=Cacopsylla melanoneura TaxID=428564 RepID=A0A8D8T794_9HEMI
MDRPVLLPIANIQSPFSASLFVFSPFPVRVQLFSLLRTVSSNTLSSFHSFVFFFLCYDFLFPLSQILLSVTVASTVAPVCFFLAFLQVSIVSSWVSFPSVSYGSLSSVAFCVSFSYGPLFSFFANRTGSSMSWFLFPLDLQQVSSPFPFLHLFPSCLCEDCVLSLYKQW